MDEDDERVPVIVRLRDQVELPAVAARPAAPARPGPVGARRAVVEALQDKAERRSRASASLLRDEEAAGRARDVRSFWIFNGLAATVSRATLDGSPSIRPSRASSSTRS